MGKWEIAQYEQFLLFPQCFHNIYTADTWKQGLVWERVKLWYVFGDYTVTSFSVCLCLKYWSFCVAKSYCFPAIVLKLCRYIHHVLKLCVTQFSTIYSLCFKDYLPLYFKFFFFFSFFCEGGVKLFVSVKGWRVYLPFPKWQILDSSKLEEFADNNFRFDENGR